MPAENTFQKLEEPASLLAKMPSAFALHEIICDEAGNPVDYRFLYVNPAFERLTGLRAAAVIGKRVLELLPKTERHWIEAYGRVTLTGESMHFEEYSEALDRYFEVSAYQAKTGQFACIFSDITEARRVSALSRRTAVEREQFYRLFQTSSDLMCIANPNGAFKRTNPAFSEALGYSEAELVSRPFLEFVHPDDKQATLDEMANQLQNGYSLNFENRYMCKNGTYRLLSWRAYYDKAEGITFATARDITEHKATEEMLLARVRLSEYATSHSLDELVTKTLDKAEKLTGSDIGFFHFLDADQQTLTLQAWSSNTVKNMCAAEGRGSHCAVSAAGVWGECIRQGAPVIHNDFDALPGKKGFPKGHASVVRQIVVPIFRNKKIVAIIGLGNKKTDYLARDLELIKKFSDTVWEIILSKRSQEALLAAKKAAENANLTKDLFLATLSHELRTPLTALLSWTQLIKKGLIKDESKIKHGINIIDDSAKALAQLIDDLLDVSRIQSGKLSSNKKNVMASDIITSALEAVRPPAESKSVRINAKFNSGSISLFVDPLRIKQVVLNLLTNAVKFSQRGGTVEVVVDQIAHLSGERCRIRVIDHGRGIDPKFLPRIFERFSQEDSSATRGFGGMGLGLAIVVGLVEMNGGTIEAASEGVGSGATFTVLLPLSEEVGSAVVEKLQPDSAGAGLLGVRILVVDDEANTREVIKEVLTTYGAQVLTSASAREAIEAIEKFTPSVLVSDIAMPYEDGYSLIRSVRKLPTILHSIPAVAITAYANAEDRKRALLAGFDDHIAKPFESDELAALIAGLVAKNRTEA